MYKKILISLIVLFLITSFSCLCLADNEGNDNNMGQDVVDGIRNVVGGAENAVEDAAKDVANSSREATGDMEKAGNDMTDSAGSTMSNNNNSGDYTATRTATGDDTTLLGMNGTTWTWVIMAIAAIAIVALIWYYAAQNNTDNYNSND